MEDRDLYVDDEDVVILEDPSTGEEKPWRVKELVTDSASIDGSQVYVQDSPPEDPEDGDVWIDNSGGV